jgi:hypothetical protein
MVPLGTSPSLNATETAELLRPFKVDVRAETVLLRPVTVVATPDTVEVKPDTEMLMLPTFVVSVLVVAFSVLIDPVTLLRELSMEAISELRPVTCVIEMEEPVPVEPVPVPVEPVPVPPEAEPVPVEVEVRTWASVNGTVLGGTCQVSVQVTVPLLLLKVA